MPEHLDEECLAILRATPRDAEAAERAFATLVHRYDALLQRQLRCRYPSLTNEDVQEVSQETWLRVWRRLDVNIRAEAFRSWLSRIGTNLAIDWIRRKSSRPVTALGDRDIASGQADHVHELGFAEKLKHCVNLLRPEDRAFLARLINLETPDEIAAALGRKKSRVYQLKHEVGKQLMSCMGLTS